MGSKTKKLLKKYTKAESKEKKKYTKAKAKEKKLTKKNIKNKTIIRSYSPSINKKLVSLKNTIAYDILGCNARTLEESLLKVNVGTLDKPKCVPYNNKLAIDHLLKNLKATVNLNCLKIIPPKQIDSNCWFNTMFMTFFISDKGRKFFRFFRQLMIEGKQIDGNAIPTELAKSFFMFNMAIEAAYNLTERTKKIAYNFDTNLLIKNIYNSINKNTLNPNRNIRNVKESGNPIDYYLSIMQYLNNHSILLRIIDFSNDFYANKIINQLGKLSVSDLAINILTSTELFNADIPHILVLEFSDDDSNKISDKKEILTIKTNDGDIQYKLDAIIIRDTKSQHFCSLLMCNGVEMGFDGASYSRMAPFKWKNLINKDKNWTFKANYDLKWNFRNGYHMLFYYRI
jgi:hypothetical protein